MKRNKKIIFIVLAVLVLTVSVTAYLNRKTIADKREKQKQALVTLQQKGEQVETVNLGFIKKQKPDTFNKQLDTSDSGPVKHSYTGVPLKNILQAVEIKVSEKSRVVVKAIDGYTVALTGKEVLQPGNVYLVYKSDGQLLKGKQEGGTGPYRLVIKGDQFGQRWCKFVTEVNVK